MRHHHLFLANTKQQVAECRYLLLKYLAVYNLKPPASIAVVVYTASPVAFEGFTNFFPHFQMTDVTALQGNATKTTLLQQFFLQQNGAVLYCDTATYPLQPLEPLFADIERGNLYLHAPYRHRESELAKIFRKRAGPADKTAVAVAVTTTARSNIWRAAVVGITDHNHQLLEKITKEEAGQTNLASDNSYTKVFGETGKIKTAAKHIFDYGTLKEFGQLLDTFFAKNEEESIPNQIKALHHIDAAAIQQQKAQYQQQPLFKKWLQAITGKKWSISQYERW